MSGGGRSLTPLFISLALTTVGAILAFDIRGIASLNYKNNSGFTPWGQKRDRPRRMPNPYRVVGWCFLVPGAALLTLTVAAAIVTADR